MYLFEKRASLPILFFFIADEKFWMMRAQVIFYPFCENYAFVLPLAIQLGMHDVAPSEGPVKGERLEKGRAEYLA